jgi:hypothetical protein
MTPTAVTPAARKRARPARPSDGSGSQRPSSPHPSTPRPAHRTPRAGATAPSAPRRVSGPARPTPPIRPKAPTRQSVSARPSAPARPSRSTRTAPRTAAPKRRAARTTTTRPRSVPILPLRARALAFARSLPDHSLLDRLIRSRIWIPLLGVLLIGIVASQVEILKLNASLGHGVVRAAQLQSEDQRLANAVSQMSDVQRIESKAAQMGLSMPAAYTPVFLNGGRGELRHALGNIHKPDPTAFEDRAGALATQRAAEVQSSSGA